MGNAIGTFNLLVLLMEKGEAHGAGPGMHQLETFLQEQ